MHRSTLNVWLKSGVVCFLALLSSAAFAAEMLQPGDFVGYSFWLISMALAAATIFFLMESFRIGGKWGTSLTVSALVTFIAAFHYMYMRDVWVTTGTSPTDFRYIDWMLTVPLLMIEFYLILAAITKVSGGIFWRLLIGALVMLIPGYMGEAGYINVTLGFAIGMLGWFYILYEIFMGEASKVAASKATPAVQKSYGLMKWTVTIGWSIYPIGYFFGYLVGGTDEGTLNIVYNLADVLNKIAFGLFIWYAANEETSAKA
ncbi:bacteriorhodopsin-like [Polaromonas sp.]|uniref:bacteriorhodopsin-like n=1 Tax=Polaromonas sp. TaxID=1869339 RepID=UPI00356A6791